MIVFNCKRGDTFKRSAQVFENFENKTTLNLAGYTIRSQVRDSVGSLISTAVITITNAAAGMFDIEFDTTSWTVGKLRTDIEFTFPSGQITSTETSTIIVEEDITI